MRILVLLCAFVVSASALASARIVHPWTALKIETDRAEVDARTRDDGAVLARLQVRVGNRSIKTPATALAEFPNPRLQTIEVMWNCFEATGAFGSQEHLDSCELIVSIEYGPSGEQPSSVPSYLRKSVVFQHGRFVKTIGGL